MNYFCVWSKVADGRSMPVLMGHVWCPENVIPITGLDRAIAKSFVGVVMDCVSTTCIQNHYFLLSASATDSTLPIN